MCFSFFSVRVAMNVNEIVHNGGWKGIESVMRG